ncbi:MAG TPA: SOS response-associated peptidase [Solirubrobacteraceae bacterium]|nr:SOS response-associated peptidase [Solirubrobacteraceae bacterium]
MCGRYSLSADPAALPARFPVGERLEIRPRYNVAPGDDILAVTTDREGAPRGELLHWGFVPPFLAAPPSSGSMINARAESVAEKPAFRGSFARFRCLIPADGFYEWHDRVAHHITRRDGAPFAFAGLWSVWHGGAPEEIRSATILTTVANGAIAPLHDRMPVILAPEVEAAWLDPGTPVSVLHDLLGGLAATATAVRPVGPAVNDARHDAPDCLDPPRAPSPPAQTALF